MSITDVDEGPTGLSVSPQKVGSGWGRGLRTLSLSFLSSPGSSVLSTLSVLSRFSI